MAEGWQGWDDYAPFYDWENAQTLARRDVAFWQRLAAAQDGPVLELGCGTGRSDDSGRARRSGIVGIDRSEPMLDAGAAAAARAAGLGAAGARRHPRSAVPPPVAFLAGDGALRHAAVADARA